MNAIDWNSWTIALQKLKGRGRWKVLRSWEALGEEKAQGPTFKQWLEPQVRVGQSPLIDRPSKTACSGGREVPQDKIGTAKGRGCRVTKQQRPTHSMCAGDGEEKGRCMETSLEILTNPCWRWGGGAVLRGLGCIKASILPYSLPISLLCRVRFLT